jgi:uncharacterized membrane protein (UPF0127 family)
MKAIIFCVLLVSFSTNVFGATEKLKTKRLVIGGQTLLVEIADTEATRTKGLMFRKSLKDTEGMLFIFDQEEELSFWMKNTFIPLSIGYFNKSKKLIDIQDMAPVASEMQTDLPSYPSKEPAMYALEVPKGWFKKNKVHLGAVFRLE